ncbi:MAG: prepilin-type N-terminal cleavage/methylation domain-containing protein [Candidatus Sumerlaeia bacterium]|nr:prepilin-type N-terminal cleavage/methylation domain-containing protein [Candidatus Sumerlaeia bacterium]
MKRGKQERIRGFSLIETLVCAVIVAILASIGLVSYQGAVDYSDLKGMVPGIVEDLTTYQKTASEKNVKVTVEFVIGTGKIRAEFRSGEEVVAFEERDYSEKGLLKQSFVFRSYKWPDGSRTPATFTFFPAANPIGGAVTYGSGFAEVEIFIQDKRITSNI